MRELLGPHQVANDIRMKRTQHKGPFLIVEGSDDSRFYKRFVDSRQCKVVVGHGKETVETTVGILEAEGFEGVLGLVDCDFDEIRKRGSPSRNIVSGDCHDLEAMLIRSHALDDLLHELASEEKLARFERTVGVPFRQWVLNSCSPLGYLRLCSLSNGLHLTFEGLRFANFVSSQDGTLSIPALVREVKNRSQNQGLPDKELIDACFPPGREYDSWHLCCGHDMVETITLALRRLVGSQSNITPEHVAGNLRLAYSREEFIESKVFTEIMRWKAVSGFEVF